MTQKQYVLGRGELFFDRMLPNTRTLTGERFIGNVTAFNISIESETLDHFDSTQGIRQKDDSVLLQINRTGAITTDNINSDNLSLFVQGSVATVTQTATPVVDYAINGVQRDRWYQLGQTAANPTGVRGVSAVTVTGLGGTPVYTLNTDYTVDLTLGRIYIPTTSTIAVNANILVDFTPAANTRDRISSASLGSIDGALRFVARNPKGPVRDIYIPYCSLTPSGELNFIGEEWLTMAFNLEIQKLNDTTEAIYLDGRPA
jgi:hypothetical protein